MDNFLGGLFFWGVVVFGGLFFGVLVILGGERLFCFNLTRRHRLLSGRSAGIYYGQVLFCSLKLIRRPFPQLAN